MSTDTAASDSAPSAAAAAAGWRYGLLGLPLAFASLPLYVHWPQHAAQQLGLPLAWLGSMLLAARTADALIDPALGRWVDRLHQHSPRRVLAAGAGAASVLAAGLAALFLWPATAWAPIPLATTLTAVLLLTCAAASLLTLAHQGWGTRLGGNTAQRTRVVAWREGMGLAGVVLASAGPALAGLPASVGACALALALGCWAWAHAPRPPQTQPSPSSTEDRWRPWRNAAFRRLLGVFALNGLASAVPATLVLFFIADGLQASAAWSGALLAAYFLSAALALPLWLRAVQRLGLVGAWRLGMGLSIAAFAGTALLGPGDAPWFAAVCVAAGAALGADLALPGALLTGVIDRAGDRGRHDGAYLGWWQVVSKLNLALAAGTALPLLAAAGYTPGSREPAALQALSLSYAVLPCLLKAGALLALSHWLRPATPLALARSETTP